ncbi:MAG: acyl-ACP--UDP-N-acetylglucosamine O-acyltransferase [Bacteroidota bacterium]
MHISIHPSANVHPKAVLADNVSVGAFTTVEEDVIVGEGTRIDSNVLIAKGARIGRECKIFHGAVIGTDPQDLKFGGEYSTTEIGDFTILREYSTIHRGTKARGKTSVGNHCYIMAYVHVAHDCALQDYVILSNAVNMAGHVNIEDHAIVGGMTPIHQFVRIGRHSMIGGGFRVSKDVPPYALAGQEPLAFQGLNSVGLRRRNFSAEVIEGLEKMYKIIYFSNYNVTQALEVISQEKNLSKEMIHVYDFILASTRGIIPGRK